MKSKLRSHHLVSGFLFSRMATTLEPPRTKQKLEEPPGVSSREGSRGTLEAGAGKKPVADSQKQFTW